MELSAEASSNDIKTAYRKFAKRYHPDSSTGNVHEFQKIQTAYQVIGSQESRKQYDVEYYQHIHSKLKQQKKLSVGRNLLYHLQIPIKDAFFGCKKNIKYIFKHHGANKTKELEISIPPGIEDGQKLRVKNAGDSQSLDQQAGDLLITIHIVNSDELRISGADLFLQVQLSPLDLLINEPISYKHFDSQITIACPRMHNGQLKQQNFKGLGYYFSTSSNSRKRGDLFVNFELIIPESIDKNTIHLLKKIKDTL